MGTRWEGTSRSAETTIDLDKKLALHVGTSALEGTIQLEIPELPSEAPMSERIHRGQTRAVLDSIRDSINAALKSPIDDLHERDMHRNAGNIGQLNTEIRELENA